MGRRWPGFLAASTGPLSRPDESAHYQRRTTVLRRRELVSSWPSAQDSRRHRRHCRALVHAAAGVRIGSRRLPRRSTLRMIASARARLTRTLRRQRAERFARRPWALVERFRAHRTGFQPVRGAGVEPATARFTVWCSNPELTTWRPIQPSSEPSRGTRVADRLSPGRDQARAAGPAASTLSKWLSLLAVALQRRRWESNPLKAALQAAAVPAGSSVDRF